ncbi:MAG: ATP-binding protein [Lachnospiraceae bacterium]|nr:ATP-binding protein [Lachnospiraceae bacterium]
MKSFFKHIGHFFRSLFSLRVCIFLIMIIVGLMPSLILYFGIMQNYENEAIESRVSMVQNQLKVLTNHLVTYNYLENQDSDVVKAELDMLSSIYEGRVMIISSSFKVVEDTYGISIGKYMVSEEVVKGFQGTSMSHYDRVNGFIEIITPITSTVEVINESNETVTQETVIGVMFTSISNDAIMDILDLLQNRAVLLLTLSMVAIVLVAFVLSGLLVVPFKRLSVSISNVKNGFFDEFKPENSYVETSQISAAFEELLDRMKLLDESRQEFVENVSHELKTPMTSMKVLADSIAAMPDAPTELYQEFFRDVTSEIDRENKIITDLLSLVKMDKKAAELDVEPRDINSMLELILKRLLPLARQKDIEVVLECVRPVTAEVDEVKMNLALTNLVENAIKYNRENGSVKVRLDADHQFFTVEVEDNGIGIPEQDLPHIYERFYRVDKSHSREIGGTGLGLAITKSAVMMHRGTIQVESEPGKGTTFTVQIPLKYSGSQESL